MSQTTKGTKKPSQCTALRVERVFTYTGLGFITAAGLYLAGMAHAITRFDAWMSAYVVLIAGVAPLILGRGLGEYYHRGSFRVAMGIFGLFMAANGAVIVGTWLEKPLIVVAGSAGVAFVMLRVVGMVRGAEKRSLLGVTYYVTAFAVFAGSIVGAALSLVRHL